MKSGGKQLKQGEVSRPPLQTRLNHYFRTERTIWIVLLVLPLLTYCVVAVLTYSIKPTPIHTGDPLYDKYLAWILDDFEKIFNLDSYGNTMQTNFENGEAFDPFAEWEAEFGDDPRYWMLRYRYSWDAIPTAWGGRKSDLGHLKRARELGVADGAILLTLLENADDEIWEQASYDQPDGQTYLDYVTESEKIQRGKVDELIGVEQMTLFAELFEVAGNDSSPHYYAALLDSQRGKYQAAINHLVDGNQTFHNTNLVGFPFDVHLSNLSSEYSLSDKIVNGSIFVDGMSIRSQSFEPFGVMTKHLVADAISRNDRVALDEIHTFGCRVGSAKGIELNTSMLGMLVVRIVETEFRKSLGGSISSEQIRDLDELINLNAQVKTFRASGGAWPQILAPFRASPFQQPIGTMEIWLSGGRSGIKAHIEAVSHDFTQEQATLSGPIKQIFQQMESFNYNTLEFE